MPLSREDIETPRSPSELKQFVERVRESVRLNPAEREDGMLRHGYYKEFLDEVVPLSRFAIQTYPETYRVQPVLGNQGYDAIVRNADSQIVDKVEIANPIDGKAVSSVAREVAEYGISGLSVGDVGDDTEDLISIIQCTVKKKAVKDYSDVTVVFNVAALPPYKGFETRHEAQIERIRQALSAAGFKAKRVFVLHPPERLERIDGHPCGS